MTGLTWQYLRLYLLNGQVWSSNGSQVKRCIQKCTLPRNQILIMTSQLRKLIKLFKTEKIDYLKDRSWLFLKWKNFYIISRWIVFQKLPFLRGRYKVRILENLVRNTIGFVTSIMNTATSQLVCLNQFWNEFFLVTTKMNISPKTHSVDPHRHVTCFL